MMSKADKMFEELGYIKKLCYGGFFFTKEVHEVISTKIQFDVLCDKMYIQRNYGELNLKELRAIFEMSKELGWLDVDQ